METIKLNNTSKAYIESLKGFDSLGWEAMLAYKATGAHLSDEESSYNIWGKYNELYPTKESINVQFIFDYDKYNASIYSPEVEEEKEGLISRLINLFK